MYFSPEQLQKLMTVPREVLDLIRYREGYEPETYADTLGNLTGGIGHLLTQSEAQEYPEGTTVPDDVIEQWFADDTNKAYSAAIDQAALLQSTDQRLINALASVSFQLGAQWYKKLFGTWALLLKHEWVAAAQHEELSLWAKETPIRAKDFATALESLVTPALSTNADAIT